MIQQINPAQICTINLMLSHPFQPRTGAACDHLHKCTKNDPFCVQAWRGDNRALKGLGEVEHLRLIRRLWVMVMCIRVMGVAIGCVRRAPRHGAHRALQRDRDIARGAERAGGGVDENY
ncbi:hypothetical protein CRN74_08040 [Yersinia frederiksenii]|nr:hypothetical protein CRN74_08040 [Yersinia frederiksenii]